jgi:hypothetical protein
LSHCSSCSAEEIEKSANTATFKMFIIDEAWILPQEPSRLVQEKCGHDLSNTMQKVTTGVSDAMHNISLSRRGR